MIYNFMLYSAHHIMNHTRISMVKSYTLLGQAAYDVTPLVIINIMHRFYLLFKRNL